jgi:hypothetical protein
MKGKDGKLWIPLTTLFIITTMVVTESHIPTTLEGPFEPVTRRFDPSLRRGSEDLPMDDPRLKKNVTSNFPEQIALAVSSPTSMSVASEVWYGKESGKYTKIAKGASTVYSQLYPFEGLLNYTSGIIHHVRIKGINSIFLL